MALEDSVTGAASAEAAGVPTIAVEYLQPLPLAPGRHRITTLEGVRVADLARWREQLLQATAEPGGGAVRV